MRRREPEALGPAAARDCSQNSSLGCRVESRAPIQVLLHLFGGIAQIGLRCAYILLDLALQLLGLVSDHFTELFLNFSADFSGPTVDLILVDTHDTSRHSLLGKRPPRTTVRALRAQSCVPLGQPDVGRPWASRVGITATCGACADGWSVTVRPGLATHRAGLDASAGSGSPARGGGAFPYSA